MAQPRRWSRPDRHSGDRHLRIRPRCRRAHIRAECDAGLRIKDGTQIDPGRLIETAFLDRRQADDPETLVLAWLAILPVLNDAPRAAALLALRLQHAHGATLSDWQRRLIALLEFIAMHRRRPQPTVRAGHCIDRPS